MFNCDFGQADIKLDLMTSEEDTNYPQIFHFFFFFNSPILLRKCDKFLNYFKYKHYYCCFLCLTRSRRTYIRTYNQPPGLLCLYLNVCLPVNISPQKNNI